MRGSSFEERFKLKRGTSQGGNGAELLSKMVSGVIQTQGARDVVKNVIADLFYAWSGNSQVKKKLTEHVILKAAFGFIDPRTAPENEQALEVFLSDPQTILDFFKAVPEIVNIILTTLNRMGDAMQALSVEDKAGAIKTMLHGIDMALLGKLTTASLQGLRAILTEQPGFLVELVQVPLETFFKNSDFAEIKELLDVSEGPMVAMVAKVVEILWTYPSKVLMLAASAVKVVNIAVKALQEVVGSVNPIAPEMLTELLFALMRDLEGAPIGALTNSLNEFIRQMHMGSVFFMEGGESLTTRDMRQLLRGAYSVIDPVLRRKAQVAIAEEKEFMAQAGTEVLKDNPEFVFELLGAYAKLKNPAIRTWSKKVRALEDLPQADVVQALSKGLAELDTQELGDGLSAVVRLANAFYAYDPQRFTNLCATVVTCLDLDALKSFSAWLIGDGLAALKPATDVIVPDVVKGVAALLNPEDASPEHRESLAALRRVLNPEQEVKGEKRTKRSGH
jgi:hypothetical protein